jgi:hypothetical protein
VKRDLTVEDFRRLTKTERAAITKWLSEHGCYDVVVLDEFEDDLLQVTYYPRPDGNLVSMPEQRVIDGTGFPWPEAS